MCSGSKSKLYPSDSKMKGGYTDELPINRSNLLELAATDNLTCFVHEVEEKGCDVDEINFWYGRSFGPKKMGYEERTPILIASLYGSIQVLDYIIRTGKVDVSRACGSDKATALHCAASGGSWSSVEAVKLLINSAGDVNATDANGKRPCDVIAPFVKSSSNSKRKTLEMLLNGFGFEAGIEQLQDEEEEEGSVTPHVIKDVGNEKKEYLVDASLPDINLGLYGSDEFRMYSFKVKPCSRAYSHDWTECPFVHPGENARRRDPRKYHYTCVPCPEFKKGTCAKGDSCEYAHGVFESWLHPAQYRTRLCKDETGCSRKVCFFAHKHQELRPLYASTGSAMPSPKSSSGNSMDLSTLSPLSLGSSSLMMPNTSSPPMSPSVACSSPMWQNKVNLTPPALQLPGSRLKTTFSARDVELDMEFLGLEKIRTQHQKHRQQLAEEMASLSSPYNRLGDLKPTNLDDFFGTLDHSSFQLHQSQSPKLQSSPTGHQIRQNMNQLRASYPSNISSSPSSRKPSPYGFDSSAAVAAAVMNSRTTAFTKRSQSFIDRSGNNNIYRYGSPNSQSPMQSRPLEWGSPDGKLDWGFTGEEVNKLRKSASFGFPSGNAGAMMGGPGPGQVSVDEPDVSWVNTLVKDVPSGGIGLYSSDQNQNREIMAHWVDQLYKEQEQMVA